MRQKRPAQGHKTMYTLCNCLCGYFVEHFILFWEGWRRFDSLISVFLIVGVYFLGW